MELGIKLNGLKNGRMENGIGIKLNGWKIGRMENGIGHKTERAENWKDGKWNWA